MPEKIAYTRKMTRFVNKNFGRLSNKEIAKAMRCSIGTVRKHCHNSGLLRMELEYWTKEQILFLKKNYTRYGDKELAEIFNKKWHKQKGWSFKHIEKKRLYLKLKRTPAQLRKIRERNKKRGCWTNLTTWKTRHAAPNGTVRIWKNLSNKFKVIKVEGKWVHYAHWLYIQTYGPFPKGCVVGFKDRDNMNVAAENLEAITKREHAIRNKNSIAKLTEEERKLAHVLKQLNQLTNQIIKQNGKDRTNEQ